MAKWRGRIIFGLVALALVSAAAYRLAYRTKPARGGGAAAIPVKVAKATRQNVPVYLDALGTVVAYHTVTVQPMITGPLTRILFTPGQFVKKGDELAEIDPAPYRAALDQAEAKLAQDKASLTNAEMQARQYSLLVRQNYTSKLQAATALATAAEDRALVKQDEASIETDRINLGYTRITAPISGRTGILQVNAGNIVSPSTTSGIVVINTLQPISVQFSLPQQDLPEIIAAMKRGKVDLLATEEGDPQTAKVLDHGTLAVLDNTVNANTGTLTLKGTFANPDLTLWPGAYVNVRTLVRTIGNAVTVPPVAVQQGPSGSFVFLVKPPTKPGGTFTVVDRKVTLGQQTETIVVVTAGLAPGDEVVTEGNSRLKGGSAIHIVTGSAGAP